MNDNPLQDGILRAVRRAEMPGVLFSEDIELHFGLSRQDAWDAIVAGHLGPWFTIRGRPVVLRETLREQVRLRSSQEQWERRELLDETTTPFGEEVPSGT